MFLEVFKSMLHTLQCCIIATVEAIYKPEHVDWPNQLNNLNLVVHFFSGVSFSHPHTYSWEKLIQNNRCTHVHTCIYLCMYMYVHACTCISIQQAELP